MGLLLFPTLLAGAQVNSKSLSAGADLIGRGKYIAQQVAMYVECHTPRDDDGRFLRTEYLKGTPVPVKAPPLSH